MSIDATIVRLQLGDGRVFSQSVDAARGSLGRPMSDADLEQKLRTLCAYGRSGVDPDPLIQAEWNLEDCGDVSAMLKLASAPHTSSDRPA